MEACFGSGVALQQLRKKIESRAGGPEILAMMVWTAVVGSVVREPCRRRWHEGLESLL